VGTIPFGLLSPPAGLTVPEITINKITVQRQRRREMNEIHEILERKKQKARAKEVNPNELPKGTLESDLRIAILVLELRSPG
jgi:hypothetical protein